MIKYDGTNVLYQMNESNDYGLTYNHTIANEKYHALLFSIDISKHENCSIPISFVISRNGKDIQYLEHYISGMSRGMQSYYFPIRMDLENGDRIKCYLWNKNKCALEYSDAKVRLN